MNKPRTCFSVLLILFLFSAFHSRLVSINHAFRLPRSGASTPCHLPRSRRFLSVAVPFHAVCPGHRLCFRPRQSPALPDRFFPQFHPLCQETRGPRFLLFCQELRGPRFLLFRRKIAAHIFSYSVKTPAARAKCFASTAVVTVPTPPGTGVAIDARSRTDSKSTSPHSFPSASTWIPTSITTAPSPT